MIKSLSQIIFGLPILVMFISFIFPELFPWSRRDFTIPTKQIPRLEADRYGVWRLETRALLRDTTLFWKDMLATEGEVYTEPALIFMFDRIDDACGLGISSEIALYCPSTQEVIVSTGEFQGVSRQVGQRNHLAVAYSVAHQIGHHVQHLRGMPEPRREEDPETYAKRVELQADCLAGVWLRSTQGPYGEFDFHDIYTIQKQFSVKYPLPTSQEVPGAMIETRDYADEQERTDWIRKGFRSGSLAACDVNS